MQNFFYFTTRDMGKHRRWERGEGKPSPLLFFLLRPCLRPHTFAILNKTGGLAQKKALSRPISLISLILIPPARPFNSFFVLCPLREWSCSHETGIRNYLISSFPFFPPPYFGKCLLRLSDNLSLPHPCLPPSLSHSTILFRARLAFLLLFSPIPPFPFS